MNLELSTTSVGRRAVVAVAGEVDLETASQLNDHALAALRDVSPHVVLDVSGVTFMDSTGLKVMVSIARRAGAASGSFAVVGSSRTVLRLLSLTGLDEAFPLYESLDDVDTDQPGSPGTEG